MGEPLLVEWFGFINAAIGTIYGHFACLPRVSPKSILPTDLRR